MREYKPSISIPKRDSFNTSKRNSIRLRIQLNQMIKFYISVDLDSKLENLKNVIDSILKQSYSIVIPQYSLRSEDGYELLEVFSIGDVLDDNQLILIDSYSHFQQNNIMMNKSTSSSVENKKKSIEKNDIVKSDITKNDITKNDIAKNEIQKPKVNTVKKSRIILPTETPVQIDIPSVKESLSSPSVEQIPSSFVIPQKEETEDATNPLESGDANDKSKNKPAKNIGKYSQVTSVPKPDNFKGFVVKKNEFDKVSGTKIEESSFKPLKKRKVEEEKFDFDF